jgi:hypothetical protein
VPHPRPSAAIDFSAGDVRVEIDGANVVNVPGAAPALGQIGFRSGLNGAVLDDILIATVGGR